MEPFTITAALAIASVVSVALTVITVRRIVSWFRDRGQIKAANTEAIAFSLARLIDNEQYATVTGVFDKSAASTQLVQGFYDPNNGEIIEARAITSLRSPEQDVIDAHRAGNGLVIYT